MISQGSTGSGSAADRVSLSLEPLERRLLLQADWTFMVYMDADNDMESDAITDFLEMAHVNTGPSVNIVAQLDRVSGFSTSFDNWTDTRRGAINQGDEPDLTWGSSIGEANMGDPATLSSFIDSVLSTPAYDAHSYALILWNQGEGWTEMCIDDTDADSLELPEIGTGISNGISPFPGVGKLDVIGFDASLMSMIEVGHEVKDLGRFMVGTEGNVEQAHLPYDDIFEALAVTPDMTAAEVADLMAAEYYEEFAGNGVSMGSIDLIELGTLSTAMDTLATEMELNSTGADRSLIADHRLDSPSFGTASKRDLGIFLSAMAGDANLTTSIQNAAADAFSAYQSSIGSFYGDSGQGTGLSIYFPHRGDSVDANYVALDFSSDTGWDEFLSFWTAPPQQDWTFMFYMCGDNNLEQLALEDFLEMSRVGSSNDVNIVVQLDRSTGYTDSYGDWTDTRRGLVRLGDIPDDQWGSSIGETNMGDPATLSAFVNWAIGTYPADRYSLTLWNHGDGWPGVIFDDDTGTSEPASPQDIVTADFNGDTILDLAVPNAADNSVAVLTGVGDGTFSSPAIYDVGELPSAIAAGDFDDDGDTDLAVTNAGDDTVSILTNTGGLFTTTELEVGDRPSAVVAEDLDGDSVADLAVANENDDTVSVLLNDGTGAFAAPVDYSVGDAPGFMAAADFDGTNGSDLAVANRDDGTVSILLNDGVGVFAAAGTSPEAVGTEPVWVEAGDLDGDGNIDLVVTNRADDNLSLLAGDGTGDFAAKPTVAVGDQPTSVTIANFDESVDDPDTVDLAVTNAGDDNVTVLLGYGDFTFQPARTYAAGDAPIALTHGDFNGDTHIDLAVANEGSDDVTVLLNNGPGTFAEPVDYATDDRPSALRLADMDQDANGVLDLVVAESGTADEIGILLGVGDGTFGARTDFSVGEDNPVSVATADFDGDGYPDAATANRASDSVQIMLNDGLGGLTAGNTYTVGHAPVSITMGQFDGGGTVDLAVANFRDDSVSVLLGNGDGTFTPVGVDFRVGDGPSSLIAADLNNDNYMELIVTCANSDQVAILQAVVDPSTLELDEFTTAALIDVGARPTGITGDDLDGDNDLDLVFAHQDDNNVGVLLGEGGFSFGDLATYQVGEPPFTEERTPRSIAIEDYDGDANLDLAVANEGTDTVSILFGDGLGAFGAPTDYDVGNGPVAIRAGDLNDDGHIDLAVTNVHDDDVSILLNNGPGSFAAPVSYPVGQTVADNLTTEQVREALEDVPENIDLLHFEACTMAMLEVGYEVRNEASIMVAPECLGWGVFGDGVLTPYDLVLSDVVARPEMSAAEVGNTFAERYYHSWPAGNEWSDLDLAKSVVDLGQVGTLAGAVDTLSDEFLVNGTIGDRQRAGVHLENAWFFASGGRDLGQFLEGLSNDSQLTSSIQNAAGVALSAYNDAVLYNYADPGQGTGISVYLPSDIEAFDSTYDWQALLFLDDTNWDEFVDWLLADVTPVVSFSSGPVTVSVFDMWGISDVDPDGISVDIDGDVVQSINISGSSPMGGLGIVITGASSVGSIQDSRSDPAGIAFIASEAPVDSISLGSDLVGENLNGVSVGGLIFPNDIDGDGSTGDLTGLYAEGSIGAVDINSDMLADVWVDGDLGSFQLGGGSIFAELVTTGDLGDLVVNGDLMSNIFVGGSLQNARFVNGTIWDPSVIDVEGSIGTVEASVIYGGNPLDIPAPGQTVTNKGATIQAGGDIDSLNFDRVWTFVLADDDFEPFRPYYGLPMVNMIAGGDIGEVNVESDMFGARLIAGADFGADYLPDSFGDTYGANAGAIENTDSYNSGTIGTVNVGWNVWDCLIASGINQWGFDTWASGYNLVTLRDGLLYDDFSSVGTVTIGGYMLSTWNETDWVGDPTADPVEPPVFVPYGIGSYTVTDEVRIHGGAVPLVTSPPFLRHPYILLEDPFDSIW